MQGVRTGGDASVMVEREVPQSVKRSSESDAGSVVTPLEMLGIGICQSVSMGKERSFAHSPMEPS